jgi:hypothetical protein
MRDGGHRAGKAGDDEDLDLQVLPSVDEHLYLFIDEKEPGREFGRDGGFLDLFESEEAPIKQFGGLLVIVDDTYVVEYHNLSSFCHIIYDLSL